MTDDAEAVRQRNRKFAQMAALVLTLAAEEAPDLIREALAEVFGIEGMAERYNRMLADSETAWQQLQETLDRLRQVNREFKDLQEAAYNVRHLEARLEKLEGMVGRMAAFLNRKFDLKPAAKAAQPKGQ